MTADLLLSRLQRVTKSKTPGTWRASCPGPMHANGDRHPGLLITEKSDGRVLLFCYAGCGAAEIVGAVGLELHELFPPDPLYAQRERRPFLPFDVFDIARREIGIVAILAADLHRNKVVSEGDYERVFTAVERLNAIGEAAYGR
ncbi:hypothetical protein [Microbacterium sp.]|uniref:hypothetical protein n=1 Tax=Microbacterium sp. TaxID=51671 RepID=UPI0027348803|nr:hypothetical protein [Microbacterium sp.]MDP3949599.1 hypothetical protein [Microbacterium sp.]